MFINIFFFSSFISFHWIDCFICYHWHAYTKTKHTLDWFCCFPGFKLIGGNFLWWMALHHSIEWKKIFNFELSRKLTKFDHTINLLLIIVDADENLKINNDWINRFLLIQSFGFRSIISFVTAHNWWSKFYALPKIVRQSHQMQMNEKKIGFKTVLHSIQNAASAMISLDYEYHCLCQNFKNVFVLDDVLPRTKFGCQLFCAKNQTKKKSLTP